jgi:hypothetical protein
MLINTFNRYYNEENLYDCSLGDWLILKSYLFVSHMRLYLIPFKQKIKQIKRHDKNLGNKAIIALMAN